VGRGMTYYQRSAAFAGSLINVRVHVVNTQAFATRIDSRATDYCYAKQQVDEAAILEPHVLSRSITDRCIALARDLNLTLAGIDLKITPQWEVYCFEVNPYPVYSDYQLNTGQPIARAIAQHLAAQSRCLAFSKR
jgi:glutathione synthase/RimK-type ligase-like ATP-grasp enzyme